MAGLSLSALFYSAYKSSAPKAPSIFTLLDRARAVHASAVYERFLNQKKADYFNHYQSDIPGIKISDRVVFKGRANYVARSVTEQLNVLQEGLSTLQFVRPDALESCEQINYYNELAAFGHNAGLMAQRDPEMEPRQAIYDNNRDMEDWASYYLGAPLTYADLEHIADTEFEVLTGEYEALQDGFKITDLDAYAQQSEYFTSDTRLYKKDFGDKMDEVRDRTAHHFYDYGLRTAYPIIEDRCHAYKAYASYHPPGRIQIYDCDGVQFDIKRTTFLASHEYVPGHHMHFYLYKKMGQCTPGRKPSVGFSEGLATYGEYLSADVVYADPAQKLGWLDYRFIRAMRIKIDVARYQDGADVNVMRDIWNAHTPPRLQDNFDQEFHRLNSSRQFQYLKYTLGHMAILRERAALEKDMGEAFDEKRFHHALLTTPLTHGPYLSEQLKIAMALDITDHISPDVTDAAN